MIRIVGDTGKRLLGQPVRAVQRGRRSPGRRPEASDSNRAATTWWAVRITRSTCRSRGTSGSGGSRQIQLRARRVQRAQHRRLQRAGDAAAVEQPDRSDGAQCAVPGQRRARSDAADAAQRRLRRRRPARRRCGRCRRRSASRSRVVVASRGTRNYSSALRRPERSAHSRRRSAGLQSRASVDLSEELS